MKKNGAISRGPYMSNFDRFPFWTGFRAPINKEGAPQNGQKINKLESNKMFLN